RGAVGAEPEAPDTVSGPDRRLKGMAGARIPKPHFRRGRTVSGVRTTRDDSSVGAERERVDRRAVLQWFADGSARRRVPEPDGAIGAGGGEYSSVGAERCGRHRELGEVQPAAVRDHGPDWHVWLVTDRVAAWLAGPPLVQPRAECGREATPGRCVPQCG